jgi:hypothetical protein
MPGTAQRIQGLAADHQLAGNSSAPVPRKGDLGDQGPIRRPEYSKGVFGFQIIFALFLRASSLSNSAIT